MTPDPHDKSVSAPSRSPFAYCTGANRSEGCEVALPTGVAGSDSASARRSRGFVIRCERAARSPCATCTSATLLCETKRSRCQSALSGSNFASWSAMARSVAVRCQRACEITLRDLHVADLVVRHREIALPFRIAGIGLRQAVSNREAVAVGGQRAGEVALRDLHVADFLVGHREIALPAGVAGIGLRQALADREAVADRRSARRRGRPARPARRPPYSYDTERSRRQPALPGSDCARRSLIARLSR